MMWGYDYGYPMMGYGHAWTGALFSGIWILVLIAFVLMLVRWLRGKPMRLGTDDRALAILRERYAKGEINKAEFDEKKKDLS